MALQRQVGRVPDLGDSSIAGLADRAGDCRCDLILWPSLSYDLAKTVHINLYFFGAFNMGISSVSNAGIIFYATVS